jgi:regulator of protease activity HflC (stomatin/prohibitin superfamily)
MPELGAGALLEGLADWTRRIARLVWEDHKSEFFYALAAVVWAVVRAMGKTVESGQTGLKFSFGRAVRVVEPGFHPLIPFVQVVRTLPTRSRTLDLPAQRVVTDEGLVFDVDANLVYRVVDVRRALIEIDDLVRGMQQVLALSVQELLRPRARAELYASEELDTELSRRMAARLEPWGVAVERAGFPSLRPSRESLRITQLVRLGGERAAALGRLREHGVDPTAALALAGTAPRALIRSRVLAARGRVQRHARRRAWLVRQAAAQLARELSESRKREGPFARHARRERERRRARSERWG